MARPRGNYAVTAVRREAIIHAALEIFGQSGYSGASLKQVAEAVGMTEAGVLHHFGTKRNLLIEVLQTRDDESSQFIPLDFADPLAFVTGWLRLADHNVSQPGIIELYAKLSAEATAVTHPAHNHFMDRYMYVNSLNERYFDLLRENGYLQTNLDGKSLTLTLVAMSDGLQIQWLLNPQVSISGSLGTFFESILTPDAWAQVQQSMEHLALPAIDTNLQEIA
jgi:AcrR family transcriptional regulator